MTKYQYVVTIEGPTSEDGTPTALDVAAEIESNLESAYPYADSIDVRLLATVKRLPYIGLSGKPNGYLPTRHPALRPTSQTEDNE